MKSEQQGSANWIKRAWAAILFPLLTTESHQEMLSQCMIDLEETIIKVHCPTEEIADLLYYARWDLADSAEWLNLPDAIELYVADSLEPYRSFTIADGKRAAQIHKNEILTMISPQLLLPSVTGIAVYNYLQNQILSSAEKLALTLEQTQRPLAVSPAYGDWTRRSFLEWIGDPENAGRWGAGELDRMQAFLERDELIQNFEYTAYEYGNSVDKFTFYADFQRINISGKWARLVRFHHRERQRDVAAI